MRMAMMAIATNSSINVKAARRNPESRDHFLMSVSPRVRDAQVGARHGFERKSALSARMQSRAVGTAMSKEIPFPRRSSSGAALQRTAV
jgi:hypothetical protein